MGASRNPKKANNVTDAEESTRYCVHSIQRETHETRLKHNDEIAIDHIGQNCDFVPIVIKWDNPRGVWLLQSVSRVNRLDKTFLQAVYQFKMPHSAENLKRK